MGSLPLISVILTTYNSGAEVLKCVESILDQEGNNEFFNIELVIVDDNSSDNTVQLLESKGLQVLSTSVNSGGPNKGRNIAMKNIKGSWVIIADHDDLWHKNRVISLLPFMERENVVISSGYLVVDKSRDRSYQVVNRGANDIIHYGKNETFLKLISKSKVDKQITYLGTLMFRNNQDLHEFEEKYGVVDFDWIAMAFENKEGIQINTDLYTRIQDGNNLSRNEDYRLKDYHHSSMFLNDLPKKYHNQKKKGLKGINGTMARYYYVLGEMHMSRKYFRKSKRNIITLFYYLTSYFGSNFVARNFKVFD